MGVGRGEGATHQPECCTPPSLPLSMQREDATLLDPMHLSSFYWRHFLPLPPINIDPSAIWFILLLQGRETFRSSPIFPVNSKILVVAIERKSNLGCYISGKAFSPDISGGWGWNGCCCLVTFISMTWDWNLEKRERGDVREGCRWMIWLRKGGNGGGKWELKRQFVHTDTRLRRCLKFHNGQDDDQLIMTHSI